MSNFMKKLVDLKVKHVAVRNEMMASNDAEEVRKLGETLEKLKEEILEVEKLLEGEKEEPTQEEPVQEEPSQNEGRSFNPLASYGLKSSDNVVSDDVRSSMEYRQAFMNYVQKGTVSDKLQFRNNATGQLVEVRANEANLLGDVGVLLPMTVIQEIIKETEKVYGQLYSSVKKINIKGGVKFPIGSFGATFKRIAEQGAPSDRQKGGSVTGFVEFSYKIGEIRLAQTLLASVISVPVFERELAKVIVETYVQAMDNEILNGVGTDNQMEGILTEANKTSDSRVLADNVITFNATEMADWKSWQTKLFAKIPLSMRNLKPQFVMTANTYEANIKTLADENNRPVYSETFNPVDGSETATFKARKVTFVEDGIGIENFNDATEGKIFGLYWVPEKAYCVNTNLEFAVRRYFDEEKNEWVQKALVINDGKILDPKYLYILKKGATAVTV